MNTLIPKKIFTVWLSNDGSMPGIVSKCIESQILMCQNFGYEHHLITLEEVDEIFPYNKYIQEALRSKHPNGVKYCKAADYLRMWYLKNEGGIFLDSDVELLPNRNFDAMLNDQMFVGLEIEDYLREQVVLGTAVVGAIPNHPMIKWWLNEVETKFRGDTADNYESSMELLNRGGVNFQDKMRLYSPDYFYPYEWLHTGETKITENTICIHHFQRSWTPEKNLTPQIVRPLKLSYKINCTMLEKFKYNIENNINFSFVKRGDGELACMNGDPGGNCDGHPYSKELGDKLCNAYEYLKDKATIVEFDDQQNYNILLHRTDSNLKEVSEFYKSIAASPRKKVFIGSAKVHDMAGILEAELVGIPAINAFESYRSIYDRIPVVENAIYIFCAGMPAKVMIADLTKENPNATYLDCGSAFDPMAGQSRTMQISKEQFWGLYDMMELGGSLVKIRKIKNYNRYPVISDEIIINSQDNFNLPQETHPERLWVIANI